MTIESIKSRPAHMIFQFSIPSIIAMVLTSLITLVDGFFIGNYLGGEGLAAVNLGLPILYVYLAVGIMIAVGGIAMAGIALGAGDIPRCNNIFNQTVVTAITVSILLSLAVGGLLGTVSELLKMDLRVSLFFRKYYALMILTYPVMILNSTLGMFIRGEGRPQIFMLITLMTVVENILLDYIFIHSLDGGIEGIALASLISVLTGLAGMLIYFRTGSRVFRFQRFSFSPGILKDTLLNGSSELIGQLSMGISLFAYNWVILRVAGVTGVAAFTVVGYAAYLFSMVIIGFGQGASPLISFSYGAGKPNLARLLRRKTSLFVFLAGLAAMLLMMSFSGWYSEFFVEDRGIAQMVKSGLVLFVLSFLFSGINTIASFYFTSLGKAGESALISSSRGLVLLLLCIFTLPRFLGMTGVWLAAPVTEALTFFLSLVLIRRSDKALNPAGIRQAVQQY